MEGEAEGLRRGMLSAVAFLFLSVVIDVISAAFTAAGVVVAVHEICLKHSPECAKCVANDQTPLQR